MLAVETIELRRVYKSGDRNPDVVALDDVSTQIEEGEIRGLLGPNGAGKTTLVKILSTVLLPTSGSAFVLGHDVVRQMQAVRQQIGIVFGGDRGLYWRLTGRQNLEYWAALYNVPAGPAKQRVAALLDRVGLTERADSKVETYSRGMKQRLHLARGLVADARVLFLDEPTVGLDPLAARDFRNLIMELRGEGRTILLTTHDMAEAEAVCDRVALIDRGRLVATETPRTLSTLVAQYERIDFEGASAELQEQLRQLHGIASVTQMGNGALRAELLEAEAMAPALQLLVGAGVTSIQTSRPSLEEVYVHIMGDRGLQVRA
ncbi:MAG TPA: ABC transporter ATP-binding protein [Dehalococcoidia bacterium]|nr:ABC transporter ATP-binding protein [Dehalococcoidia bacterium]